MSNIIRCKEELKVYKLWLTKEQAKNREYLEVLNWIKQYLELTNPNIQDIVSEIDLVQRRNLMRGEIERGIE